MVALGTGVWARGDNLPGSVLFVLSLVAFMVVLLILVLGVYILERRKRGVRAAAAKESKSAILPEKRTVQVRPQFTHTASGSLRVTSMEQIPPDIDGSAPSYRVVVETTEVIQLPFSLLFKFDGQVWAVDARYFGDDFQAFTAWPVFDSTTFGLLKVSGGWAPFYPSRPLVLKVYSNSVLTKCECVRTQN